MGRSLQPAGAGLTLVILTITVLALCWLTVLLRLATRRAIHALGLDDWLMFAGLILWTIAAGAIIGTCYHGAGRPFAQIPVPTFMLGIKWYLAAHVTYSASTVPIRCSICCTLLRIAKSRPVYRYILYGIMVLSVVAGITSVIATLMTCRPLAAFWLEVKGTCNYNITMSIGYFLSAVCIATDWAVAVLPAIILWNIQLKRRVKIYVITVLALGGLASCATIVRLKYITRYGDFLNFLYNAAFVGIWTTVEAGIGICVGSIAQLRPALRFIPFIKNSTYARSPSPGPTTGTPNARPEIMHLPPVHIHKCGQGAANVRRIHGRAELDLQSDNDSQDERLNASSSSDIESGLSPSLSSLRTTETDNGRTIRKQIEVKVQPWVPGQGSSVEEVDANGRESDRALHRSSYRTEVWYRHLRA